MQYLLAHFIGHDRVERCVVIGSQRSFVPSTMTTTNIDFLLYCHIHELSREEYSLLYQDVQRIWADNTHMGAINVYEAMAYYCHQMKIPTKAFTGHLGEVA